MLRVLPILLSLGLALAFSPVKAQASDPSEQKKANETDQKRLKRLRLQRSERILNRKEIEAAMAPHVPAIAACYKQHTAKQKNVDGKLSLEMLIHPEGTLQKLWVHAPSVRGDALETCIEQLAKTWRFPKKPGFTNAIVPFFFQKTNAKGAGPLQSCWSAKGCPETQRSKRKGKQPKGKQPRGKQP